MDDKASLHNHDPFNPVAEAANAPEATIAAVPETPPDEVMAALEMLAAFPEDPPTAVDGARTTIEASCDMHPLDGAEVEVTSPDIVPTSLPGQANESVEAAPDPLKPAEPSEPDAAPAEAPWAVPTHAEHRDSAPLSSEDEPIEEPFDTLEDGIASIFARLHAETQEGSDEGFDGAADDAAGDEATEADDTITFQLLGELDRLWHRAER